MRATAGSAAAPAARCKNCLRERFMAWLSASLRLDARFSNDRSPFRQFALDLGDELVGRIGDRGQTERRKAVLHIRPHDDLGDFPMEQRNDLSRRSGWD